MRNGRVHIVCFILVLLTCGSIGDALEPATQAAGEQRSMSKDLFHFTDPPSPPWSIVGYKADADSVVYITDSRQGEMQLMLLPKDATVDPGIADNVAVAIIKQIRADRAKAGVKVIMAAKSEKDSRFAICIHEKYKAGDHTADQLHVYQGVGPRVLMLTVNSVADDPDVVAAEHKAGEDLLLSAKFNRAAFKPVR